MADSAILVERIEAGVGARADLGLARLIAGVGVARSHYLPIVATGGTRLAQGFRDDRAIAASLRVERSLAGGRVLFAETAYRWLRSVHPGAGGAVGIGIGGAPGGVAGATVARTGSGGEVLAGLRGEITPLVMVEAAAGYQWRSYRSPLWRDWRGAAWRARAEWYATPLVTFVLAARRDLVNSPQPSAGGVVVDSFEAKALYELRRSVVLTIAASHAVERYRDLAGAGTAPAIRSDAIGLEAAYATGRHLLIGLFARYRDRRSASPFLPGRGRAVESGVSLRFSL